MGLLSRVREGLRRTAQQLVGRFDDIARRADTPDRRGVPVDAETAEALEELLISADVGVAAAGRIVSGVTARARRGESLRDLVKDELRAMVSDSNTGPAPSTGNPTVVLVVGVNGTGKTTTAAKLAHHFMTSGKSVLLAAADTFRAAAIDQLKIWGKRIGAEVVAKDVGADPAGVAFEALQRAQAEACDVLLIDTAGRLQNKTDLMAELAKIVRVLKKLDENAPHSVVLVLDATTGQNALAQVQIFQEIAGVTSLVVTKLDGTARGGILVAIAERFGLPINAIGVGEGLDDLEPFDAQDFARAIAGLSEHEAAA